MKVNNPADAQMMNVVFVSNPAYQTQYGCAQCNFKTVDIEKLWNHKTTEGHLNRGIVDSVISTRQIPKKVRCLEKPDETEKIQCNACALAFTEYSDLKKHILTAHEEISDICKDMKISLVRSKVEKTEAHF